MDRALMKGCEAIAETAIRAGCRFYSGYPITPQNEIPEYFARRMPEVGGVFIQGESEIASANMVLGAGMAGARAMTSSSGPGISLKSEALSSMAAIGIPAVICNAMRGGPGTGSITHAQSDYLQATKASGHGGFQMIVLAPSTVQEAVDLTYMAFDLADRDRNPVLLLIDGLIAAVTEPVNLPDFREVDINAKEWAVRGRGDGPRKLCSHGDPSEAAIERQNLRMAAMIDTWQKDIMVEKYLTEDAEIVIAAYGTSARISRGVVDELRAQGQKIGMIRPITVNPFPYEAFESLDPDVVKHILVVEMTVPAQMVYDVKLGVCGRIPISTYGRSGGMLVKHEEIKEKIDQLHKEAAR